MRFLRHLAAVLVLVAVVVLLAMAWNHAAGGGLASGPLHGRGVRMRVPAGQLTKGPNGSVVIRLRGAHGLRVFHARPMDLGLTSMFDSVNLPSLRRTVVIEAGAAAAVVLIDVIRRRWRRRARTTGS